MSAPRRDTRPVPTEAEAEGMREGILSQRRQQGLTGPHPYGTLDFTDPADRRIIASVYAEAVPRVQDDGLLCILCRHLGLTHDGDHLVPPPGKVQDR